ncbi:DUF1376 domain-containing protein [Bradyrhizobium septentrionale]|uniref:DUF1376 domain-containing protein n=1 Tax=Bradyrhizobium septentrionale TaxID=1404411 RepID=A0A973WA13_9BRAD|nr:DUF1376 domain-containing protein [Bradyrhizobium septentrionale]UGY18610.1 DUF1376 domain-containing protein [Bradyrhizobium septentrionale]
MNPPKMPIHIGDFLRDTGHLRAAGIGSYLLLLFHYWSTGCLPDDDEQLACIARTSPAEWKKAKPVLEKFFKPGWKLRRVEEDLASARESYERRAKAGEKGGKAKAIAQQSCSNATALPEQPFTFNQGKKDSDANASGAEAPPDHRKRLFSEGLAKIAAMTGKGPDACRSFVGKCLKAAGDDAVIVLGLIEDAERNRVVDPSAWIAARLKGGSNGTVTSPIIQAADDLRRQIASFAGPGAGAEPVRGGSGEATPRLLSQG